MAARQLPLDLPHADSRARADFLPAPANLQALALVDSWPDWPARIVALAGPEGSGKSHLAALFAERAQAPVIAAERLRREGVPEALAGGALVIEDLGEGVIEETALFHLINLAGELGTDVLMTMRRAPAALAQQVATRDLASRLRAMPAVTLDPPDDALLAAVAVKLFLDRQITPDEAMLAYILPRVERSIAALRDLVACLDREALARKRPLTRALAAQMLRAREAANEAAGSEAVGRSLAGDDDAPDLN